MLTRVFFLTIVGVIVQAQYESRFESELMKDLSEVHDKRVIRYNCPKTDGTGIWRSRGSYCYFFSYYSYMTTFKTAKSRCAAFGATLASVHSSSENSFVRGHVSATYVWLGGIRAHGGGWIWLDGSNWRYSNWATGQPDHGGGYCMELTLGSGGRWHDAGSCSYNRPYVCKTPKTIYGKK